MTSLLALDGNILLFIQDHIRTGILDPVMIAVTKLGDYGGLFWILMALTMIAIKRTRPVGIRAAIGMVIMGIVNNVFIKILVDRTRPYEVISGLDILIKKPVDASFPSGHTALAFTFTTVLLLSLPLIMEKKIARRISIAFIILSVLIAMSRLYVGVHYPSDVLGGLLLGIGYGFLGNLLGGLLIKRFPRLTS